ncbi:MAG: BTAD domain-containing putative transcriptional regulator [Nanoarchaeota archaeon]
MISEETAHYHKIWKLFKYLLTKKGNSPNVEVIMETLWPHQKVNNINHTLRNLIYRLRKNLKDKEFEYIKSSEGTYNFNFNSDYWYDAEIMESLFKKAHNKKSSDELEAIKIYKKGLSLYKGYYLPKLIYEDWSLALRNYYHNIYLQSALEMAEILHKNKRFKEIKNICEEVFNYEMFQEKLHFYYLNALIKQGQKKKAQTHFKYVKSLFDQELGLEISGELKSLISRMETETNFSTKTNLESINKNFLNEKKPKTSFFCDPITFQRLCRLEQSRAERKEQANFLCTLSIVLEKEENNQENEFKNIMYTLQHVLLNKLRQGDIFCRWNEKEFLLLLWDIDSQVVETVLNRIAVNLKKETAIDNFLLIRKYSPLKTNTKK